MKLLPAAFLLPAVLARSIPLEDRSPKITYDGYKAFRVATHHDPAEVRAMIASLDPVAFNMDADEHLDVAIAPGNIAEFEKLGLETSVIHEDLGADIRVESEFPKYERAGLTEAGIQAVPSLSWFDNYHAYADHLAFFQDLQASFPNRSSLFNVGSSYQGRSIWGIHLWGRGGPDSRPIVYFHGTVHAREWIAGPVLEYITYSLLTGYGKDSVTTAILDSYDFYILPFVNPDGFSYSQTNDRLWRKNRQPRSISSCVGTDMNRNWPYRWEYPGGASTNPCSETYKGQSAGDTPEMRALTAFTSTLTNKPNGIRLFIDWHSYGQYILIPYGYNCALEASNGDLQYQLAQQTSRTIQSASGSRYTYGQSCSTLYATTGSAPDYMTDTAKIPFAWTIELRPGGSSGGSGFILPASQILPTGQEQWAAMRYLLRAI